MIIFRPMRNTIEESMKEAKEFKKMEDLKEYLCKETSLFIFSPQDFFVGKAVKDKEEVGWKDTKEILIKPYSQIKNKDGYLKYFGKKFDTPLCMGYYATEYEKPIVPNVELKKIDQEDLKGRLKPYIDLRGITPSVNPDYVVMHKDVLMGIINRINALIDIVSGEELTVTVKHTEPVVKEDSLEKLKKAMNKK